MIVRGLVVAVAIFLHAASAVPPSPLDALCPSPAPVVDRESEPAASPSGGGDPVQRIVVALLALAALLGAGGAYGLYVTKERR